MEKQHSEVIDHSRGVMTGFLKHVHQDTHEMDRADIFKVEQQADRMISELKRGDFAKYASDNKIIETYIDAKLQGNYRHILYDCNAPKKTVFKNLIVLRKLSHLFDKPISELKEEDVYNLQNKLNNNEILCANEPRPISYAYKCELVKHFKQFWTFYRAYTKFELEKETPNIVEYLRIRKNKKESRIVNFLTQEEIGRLADSFQSLKMKTFIRTFFETGARTVEILNLKMHNCQLFWIMKLVPIPLVTEFLDLQFKVFNSC